MSTRPNFFHPKKKIKLLISAKMNGESTETLMEQTVDSNPFEGTQQEQDTAMEEQPQQPEENNATIEEFANVMDSTLKKLKTRFDLYSTEIMTKSNLFHFESYYIFILIQIKFVFF
jgi:hypothetical protein